MKAKASNPVLEEKNIQDPVLSGRPQGDRVAVEGMADFRGPPPVRQLTLGLHFADLIVGAVFDGGQGFGEKTRTRMKAADRRLCIPSAL